MPACLQIPQCPHKSRISNLTSASSQSLNTAMSSDSQNFIPHMQFIRIQLNVLHTVTNPAATAFRFSVRNMSQRWRTFQSFVCWILFFLGPEDEQNVVIFQKHLKIRGAKSNCLVYRVHRDICAEAIGHMNQVAKPWPFEYAAMFLNDPRSSPHLKE